SFVEAAALVGRPEDADIDGDGVKGEVEHRRASIQVVAPARQKGRPQAEAESERARRRRGGRSEGFVVANVNPGRTEKEPPRGRRRSGSAPHDGSARGDGEIEIPVE